MLRGIFAPIFKKRGGVSLAKLQDLTGKQFGRFVVVKRVLPPSHLKNPCHSFWLCRCSCGNEKIVSSTSLRSGTTKSCGCYSRDVRKAKKGTYEIKPKDKRRRYHQYETIDDYIKVHGDNYEFFIDVDDIEIIENHYWTLNNGYLESNIRGRRVRLHRLIMNAPPGTIVDHQDHDKLNNRKNNLRICNKSQNGQNATTPINNRTGIIGVCWNKRARKWEAQIKCQYQNYYLGIYADMNDAIKARLKSEAKLFKEFAPQKHLFKQYGIEVETLTN